MAKGVTKKTRALKNTKGSGKTKSFKKTKKGDRPKRSRAIGNFIINKRSIVPNIITMSNMTMGFFAIIFASRGDAQSLAIAGVLVFIGSMCDAADGAVARAMHVESPVGVQLDSLADGIAYGIAPAVISYQAYLSKLPQGGIIDSGMLIALIYPICAIYRLARFNISSDSDHLGFTGLPSPAAGIMISAIPALEQSVLPLIGQIRFTFPLEVFIPLYVIVGLLMVSRIDYTKLTAVVYRKGKFLFIIAIIMVILFFGLFRMWAVFVVTGMYILIGLIQCMIKIVIKLLGKRKASSRT